LASFVTSVAVGQHFGVKDQLAITSMAAQGTNLTLVAAVPAALGQVTLEMRPAADARWQAAGVLDAPDGGGKLTFTIPKPGEIHFFRLRASSNAAGLPAVSTELNYVTIPPLGPDTDVRAGGRSASAASEAVFHFKGMVDGSDRILITHEGALWEHAHWGWPEGPVTVNRRQWDPRQKNYLTAIGATQFLPEWFSLEAVDLERISGRDVVALERQNDALVVYIDDTPGGAGEYEFRIRFHPAQPQAARTATSATATLKIAADIDGSDCLKITPAEATWTHKHWQGPANVSLGEVSWSVEQTNVLQNVGTNRFLPTGIDISSARILSRKGRDLATLWAEDGALWIWFADNPNGADHYELGIGFGQ
jgi:hypothetical protein